MAMLSQCSIGQSIRVVRINGESNTKRRLVAFGVLPGTVISITRYAPLGDPIEVWLRHYSLSLRLSEAELIEVEEIH
jgi:ferrous iron transport protein A